MGCFCQKERERDSYMEQQNTGEFITPRTKSQIHIQSSYYNYTDDFHATQLPEQIVLDDQSDNPFQTQKSIQITEFALIKVLGRGSFGKVLLVKRNGKLYAMKVLKKAEVEQREQKQNTQYERQILAQSNSDFVVKLHYAFQTKHKLYLVIDFQQGGELFFHLRKSNRFNESKTRFYAAELLLALEHLHNKKIIYRDLKPENIMIGRDGHIKLTDFGLSKCGMQPGEKSYSFVGTPEYLAPEIQEGWGHNHVCDFWSLGALIYEMLSGAPPHYSENKSKMFKNKLEKPLDIKAYFSLSSASLLSGLLCNDPRYRLGAGGHNEIKSHEFFKDINWDELQLLKRRPPFVPVLDSDQDLRYFDPFFTQEPPKDTVVLDLGVTQEKYPHFSYKRVSSQ